MGNCRFEDINYSAFKYYRRLARLQTYCREHYQEDISLQQAADIAALERTYFSTYFHSKVGVCLGCWLTMLRIKEAMSLIQVSNTSITSVAYEVGYKDLTSFGRAFKRCTGMTASAFKKTVRPA